MARWAYLSAPIAAVLLLGTWWAADQALSAPEPRLGSAVVVTPAPSPSPDLPSPSPSAPENAVVVPLEPPPDAGEDSDDVEDDVADDLEDDPDEDDDPGE